MNWKLILALSLFGLAMGFATLTWNSPKLEQFLWLLIFLLCAWLIGKNAERSYFLHGFLVSLLNCVWVTGLHMKYADTYIAHHTAEAGQYAKMNAELGLSIQQSMLLIGPFIGIFSGIILGLFSLAASKILEAIRK